MKIHLIKYMICVLFMIIAFACGSAGNSNSTGNGGSSNSGGSDPGGGDPGGGDEPGDGGDPTCSGGAPASLEMKRYGHTATLLSNCKVLIVGGQSDDAGVISGAEIYDPANGKFTATEGSMDTARVYHTATLLNDGRVLIVGGYKDESHSGALETAELYDPAKDMFFLVEGPLERSRVWHTATLLRDGKVLVVGGTDGGEALNFAEVYDLEGDRFTRTNGGDMERGRYNHSATLLNDGRVLIVGGTDGGEVFSTSELFDPKDEPVNGVFNLIDGNMEQERYNHTATLLNDGMVLITGGITTGGEPLATAVIFDFEAADAGGEAYKPIVELSEPRAGHTAILLDGGKVLIIGGTTGGPLSAELYDPKNPDEGFTRIDSITETGNRQQFTATKLDNGEILIVGGKNEDSGDPEGTSSVEIYNPNP